MLTNVHFTVTLIGNLLVNKLLSMFPGSHTELWLKHVAGFLAKVSFVSGGIASEVLF